MMSQTSFLESVVTWDEKLCQQNVEDALPKLVSYLQEAAALQEEIGILKIICVSFLPFVEIDEAEVLVFGHVALKSCTMLDKVMDDIRTLSKQSRAQRDFHSLLEVLVQILDCFTLCIKHAQGAGSSLGLAAIHSLPHGAIHLLKGTYCHCKDSGDVYGDVIASVTQPLSVLFKKAHALQVAFLGLLETISVYSGVSRQDVDDLCSVCQGLFDVCQIVASLDVKLVVSLWKAVSRLSGKHKSLLKDGLDVDAMVTYLCTEINKGYVYLLQLAPPSDNKQELSLSQGDSAAFQKSLKVLGYQLRVIICLLDNFIDCVSGCVKSASRMIIAILWSLPPSIDTVNISASCIDEIQRHLVNGIEPLVSLIIQNRTYMTYILSQDEEPRAEDRLAHLQLLLKIGDCLPKQTDDVLQPWMCFMHDDNACSVFDLIFYGVNQCYVEMCLPLTMQGVKEVPLYEYICTHICGLVGSLPAKYFCVLEECLLQHLFSVNVYVSSMAEDVWCFLARFGSAELCYQQTKLLVDVCCVTSCPYSIVKLVRRLVKFLAPDHQSRLLKCYQPYDSLGLWCDIFVPVIPSAMVLEMWTALFKQANETVHSFISGKNNTYSDLIYLLQSLKYVTQLLTHCNNEHSKHQHSTVAVETVGQLWALWDREWTGEAIYDRCLSQLTDLSGLLTLQFGNAEFLAILELLENNVKTDCVCIKIATCTFLQRCKNVKFAPDSKQPMILKTISVLFGLLLNDGNDMVHHTALEAFTQFAECTPYEALVPECLGDNQDLQDKVVAFLSKTPQVSPDFHELSYLKQQYVLLCHHQQQQQLSETDQQQSDVPQQHTDHHGHQQTVCELPGRGDMLDDIQEPSLKRKRCRDDLMKDSGIQTVIVDLELNVSRLELVMSSTTLSVHDRNRLQTVHEKLTNIIEKT